MAEVLYDKRLINVDDYYRMAEIGILGRDDRVELINGEIISMSPIGSKHAGTVNRINRVFAKMLGDQVTIAIQNPVRLDEVNEPEPDISIMQFRDDLYSDSHPEPKDVLLVIEVADCSIDYDLFVKSPIYASASIPEYWVVNLHEKMLTQFTIPENGSYSNKQVFTQGQTLNWSGSEILVKELIG